MSSTSDIIEKLKTEFKKKYNDTFLFAPGAIQKVLYVNSQLRLDEAKETLKLNDLCDKVIQGEIRSFLILGDSGSGKTSFALKLCQVLWRKSGQIIPIYIHLPTLVKKLNQNECNSESELNMMKILVKEFGINGIERYEGQIVVILDSFDEIHLFAHRSKIVQNFWNNTLSWLADVSVLICSRPEAVPKSERQDMFEFVKFGHVGDRKYSEYTLEELSGDTISNFLKKMEKKIIPRLRNLNDEELINWKAWGTLKSNLQGWKSGNYKQWFKSIPDLRILSENPYVLTLICQTLPGIVLKLKNEKKVLKKLCGTRVGIFRSFTEQIFEYQAHRVSQRPVNLKPGAQTITYSDWLAYFRAYAQNLAGKWFDYANDERVVKMSDRETLDPSLVEPVLKITQLKKLEKIHQDLFPPSLTHYEEAECRTAANASNPIQIENMKILRDACNGSILVYSANEENENEYTFIHRSMLEYFASEQAFESSLAEYDLILGQNMDNPSAIYGKTGFGRVLIKDRDILSQLVERMSFEYKNILFKLIRVSKEDSKLDRISANAITILNKAHVCFSGQDYRDIQIQGADLRQSICVRTDFRSANLTNAKFGESFLIGAQFQGACMKDTDFGEFRIFNLSSDLNSMVSYRDHEITQDAWVVASRDGAVRIWNTEEEELVLPQRRDISDDMDTRLALLDLKVAVWAENAVYPKSSLSTTMVTYEVSLYDLFPKWNFFRKHSFQTAEGVDQVCVQFRPIEKCVFIYSTCHLEVISYLPRTESYNKKTIPIGHGDRIGFSTFVSIVDKNGDIQIACYKRCVEDGRIVVYKCDEGSDHFRVMHNVTTKPPSSFKEDFNFTPFDRILFKPDGSGLAIYNAKRYSLRIFENYTKIITPAHSNTSPFRSLTFDSAGKYLAGSSMVTRTIVIWNVPSGTMHRQFGYSAVMYQSRFSNPLVFSSDSKAIAFAGSASYSHPTMKLSSIDESPSIHDLARTKFVYDLAVSVDGQIVVIVGTDHARYIFNYIEIFNFPFQSSTGLIVRLPTQNKKLINYLSIGITDSKCKCSEISRRIIVIQEVKWRAFVVCSNSGNILQVFRFEETMDVNEYDISCLNKQTSLFCIYSSTQGCFLWEIFENDNSKITVGRKTELKLLNEIGMRIKELRFDYTGRYLQIVSDPLIKRPDGMTKIKMFDTLEKTVKEVILPLSADIKLPIRTVETDMTNTIMFLCSGTQLVIFSLFDATSYQHVDYKFKRFSKLRFDPLSGWLFATCFSDRSLVIFKKDDTGLWTRALEIPLWFEPYKCVCYEKNKKKSVLLGGYNDLCYIEFEKNDCRSWRLLWSMRHCHKLTPMNSNVEGALHLSKRNAGVLKGLGAVGEPHENTKSSYLPFSDWCQEIFGSARSKFNSPFIKTAESHFTLTEDMWVVSLVGNLSHIQNWRAHVYFVVEGIKNNRRFITRIHLTYSKNLKEVSIVVSPVVDRTPINDQSWEDSKYIEFVDSAGNLSAQQYGMSRKDCEQFLRNIQSSMQVNLDYNLLFNNCAVWCEEQLEKVGREVCLQGFTFALIFPRVSKLLQGMRFW